MKRSCSPLFCRCFIWRMKSVSRIFFFQRVVIFFPSKKNIKEFLHRRGTWNMLEISFCGKCWKRFSSEEENVLKIFFFSNSFSWDGIQSSNLQRFKLQKFGVTKSGITKFRLVKGTKLEWHGSLWFLQN